MRQNLKNTLNYKATLDDLLPLFASPKLKFKVKVISKSRYF